MADIPASERTGRSSAGVTVPPEFGRPEQGWRLRMYTIIFEADTRAGRWFAWR